MTLGGEMSLGAGTLEMRGPVQAFWGDGKQGWKISLYQGVGGNFKQAHWNEVGSQCELIFAMQLVCSEYCEGPIFSVEIPRKTVHYLEALAYGILEPEPCQIDLPAGSNYLYSFSYERIGDQAWVTCCCKLDGKDYRHQISADKKAVKFDFHRRGRNE